MQWGSNVDTSCLAKRNCQVIPYTSLFPLKWCRIPLLCQIPYKYSVALATTTTAQYIAQNGWYAAQIFCISLSSFTAGPATPLSASICAVAEISSVQMVHLPISEISHALFFLFLISPTSLAD